MLVMSREVGESVVIEDVVMTLARVGDRYAEVSLRKVTGGKKSILTLPHNERKAICYNVEVVFIEVKGEKARFGFEHPTDVTITRQKFHESGGGRSS